MSILKQEKHGPLIAGIEKWSAVAGISPRHIEEPVSRFGGGDPEKNYLANYITWEDKLGAWWRVFDRVLGMLYQHSDFPDDTTELEVADLFKGMAGALTRHYISCKVISVVDLAEAIRNDNPPSNSFKVLFIPDFYTGRISNYMIEKDIMPVYRYLLKRMADGLHHVLYVDSIPSEYGTAVCRTISTHLKDRAWWGAQFLDTTLAKKVAERLV